MPSSDIYNVKNSPGSGTEDIPPSARRRRKSRRVQNFDEVTSRDLSKTHRRRSKNSGFRRFRHLLKRPEFSKKFWVICFYVGVGLLSAIMAWDHFFRYPAFSSAEMDAEQEVLIEPIEAMRPQVETSRLERTTSVRQIQTDETSKMIYESLTRPTSSGIPAIDEPEDEKSVEAILRSLSEPQSTEDLFSNGGVSQ